MEEDHDSLSLFSGEIEAFYIILDATLQGELHTSDLSANMAAGKVPINFEHIVLVYYYENRKSPLLNECIWRHASHSTYIFPLHYYCRL